MSAANLLTYLQNVVDTLKTINSNLQNCSKVNVIDEELLKACADLVASNKKVANVYVNGKKVGPFAVSYTVATDSDIVVEFKDDSGNGVKVKALVLAEGKCNPSVSNTVGNVVISDKVEIKVPHYCEVTLTVVPYELVKA